MKMSDHELSEPARRMRIALIKRGEKRRQFADGIQSQPTTVGNWLRGARCSDKTRRKITAYLGVKIWDDLIPFVFAPGDEIISRSVAQAIEASRGLRHSVIRNGRTITFTKPAVIIVHHSDAADPFGRRVEAKQEVANTT